MRLRWKRRHPMEYVEALLGAAVLSAGVTIVCIIAVEYAK